MIPLEPVTALVGLAVGAYVKLKQQQNENFKVALMGREVAEKGRQNARDMQGPGIQWTKRTLALMLTVTFCALHLGVSLPELMGLNAHVTIGYTELVPKFLWFGEKEAIRWVTIEGSTLTPALSHTIILIVSYYFGSGGTR